EITIPGRPNIACLKRYRRRSRPLRNTLQDLLSALVPNQDLWPCIHLLSIRQRRLVELQERANVHTSSRSLSESCIRDLPRHLHPRRRGPRRANSTRARLRKTGSGLRRQEPGKAGQSLTLLCSRRNIGFQFLRLKLAKLALVF